MGTGSDGVADVVATLRRTIDAALADLISRTPGDADDLMRRSERVAGRLRTVRPAADREGLLASVVTTVDAACDHLRFLEVMEACTLLSAASGQLLRLRRPAAETTTVAPVG